MKCPFGSDSDENANVEVPFSDATAESFESSTQSERRQPSPLFQLVRLLKGYGHVNPRSCKSDVQLFSRKHRLPFKDTWTEFNLLWEEVKYPNYRVDGFDKANEKAKNQPIRLAVEPLEPKDLYIRTASIAYYLFEHNQGNEFLLPVLRLMRVLKLKSTRLVSKILAWLKRHDVIRCVDETYSFGGRNPRGKKYVLGSGITKVQ